MKMFRRTIFSLFLISSLSVLGQNITFDGVCNEALEKFTICLFESDYTGDTGTVDDVACTQCFADKNFFQQFDATSCTEANKEICSFFAECSDVCFPEVNVCTEEVQAYYTCYFGLLFAPENCLVQCDGQGTGGGSEGGNGSGGGDVKSDEDAVNGNGDSKSDSTSDSSTSKMIKLSITGSTILLLAGLLL
jgi:hypothetical protein